MSVCRMALRGDCLQFLLIGKDFPNRIWRKSKAAWIPRWWYGAEPVPEFNASFVLMNQAQSLNAWKDNLCMKLRQTNESNSKATGISSPLQFSSASQDESSRKLSGCKLEQTTLSPPQMPAVCFLLHTAHSDRVQTASLCTFGN